ncbi:type I polyketide synthase [Rhodococcoides yunnanense]|uniref:Beta-ketoacyl synthase N-terminal-like domain-containing protein n=1 Tax=Rhodococcoides yunnanense TaxID=278209 RepID=A0ABU4BI69_9NOCA|nr:beta-ketoacyl synthase N-terminal-like domain-containing protein [Rhodococcus yunnanensis]MDV6263916.1 beta-ketoacyl synthase N-terminal-like domain-containing protein [Rhodococcus yunnanensis]
MTTQERTSPPNAIAVVGMACRFPGADGIEAYWQMLRDGVEGITHFATEELIDKGVSPQLVRHPDFVAAKGYLPDSSNFDWQFFRYNRADAANIDPQQRVFLECASTAIDDAGFDPARFAGRVGIYAGSDRTPLNTDGDLSPLVRVISHEKDFVATRVAYKLGLRGPAVTVQTACSTSLTAIHMAARALLGGECDAALAGGVAVSPPGEWGYLHESGSVLSPDGHCRTFDARAGGTVPSEGVGVVVLKRLEDAELDGDRVLAVIRGSALNNDGSDKIGFTAPSIPGQSEVIRHAHQVSGVEPGDIGYIECHGTATRMGDPVEVAALTDAFEDLPDGGGPIWLGAVKSNLGHTSAAAGVAGFIKTVLMLKHRELVPTLHYTEPNPLLDLSASPFEVSVRTQPWPGPGTPTAAVSAFGVGGTNAHVVLQAAPEHNSPVAAPGDRVLMLSAATPEALDQLRIRVADRLTTDSGPELAAAARTLLDRRVYPCRQTVVAADSTEAGAALRAARPATTKSLGKVAFLFPGHGVLRHPAGASAYRMLPVFRDVFDEVNAFMREEHNIDITPLVTPDAPSAWFEDFVHQQVCLFALPYALGRQLGAWGIEPTALVGNSVGEFAAAALAGMWTATEAATLVLERSRAIGSSEPGRMLAVAASADEIACRIDLDGPIDISSISRGGVVLSGPVAAVEALLSGSALVGLDTRMLNLEVAGHSSLVRPAGERLTELITAIPPREPQRPMVLNTTGGWAEPAEVAGTKYWAEQVYRPVLLDDCMQTLLDSDCRTFLELGAGSTMLGVLRLQDKWEATHSGIALLGRAEDGNRGLLRGLGALWEHGAGGVEEVLAPAEKGLIRVSLPGHPFAAVDPADIGAATTSVVSTAHHDPTHALAHRLWCAALGVPVAAPQDDFLELGGESLVALQLMRQLRDRLGVDIPAVEFLRQPTFGYLLELLDKQRDDTVSATVPGLVVLREGIGRPLFLIADAAESALSYLELTGHLDDPRPVYGLEPRCTGTRTSVEDNAAEHLTALVSVQPHGPYTLGGWSFGAIVAHELAAKLIARGEEVDLLVCLDAYVPGKAGRRIGSDPAFVAGHLRLLASSMLGLGEVGAQAKRNPALPRLLRDKFVVLAGYRPRPVDCRALVLKVEVDPSEAARLGVELEAFYSGGVTVCPVSGDHWSMLRGQHAAQLAALLTDSLRATEGNTDGNH